jgi:hypothetical protein
MSSPTRAAANGIGTWLGTVALVLSGCALAGGALSGCAKDPTEILITVSADSSLTLPVTSLAVSVTDPAGRSLGGGVFIYLAAPPAGAPVAPYVFPATIQVALSSDAPAGDVAITVEASDPTTTDYVLARGVGAGTVAARSTTQGAVTLTAVAPPAPDGGVVDGTDDAEAVETGTP